MGKIFLDVAKFKLILMRRFWTLKTLADNSGVTYPTICAAAGEKNKPIRLETLKKICRALSCDPAEIVRV